jgi:Fe-S-cluster containining protein
MTKLPILIDSVRQAYREFDLVSSNHLFNQPVDCRAGCDFCCYHLIFVTPLEGLFIRQHLDLMRVNDQSLADEIISRLRSWVYDFNDFINSLSLDFESIIKSVEQGSEGHSKWAVSILPLYLTYLSLKKPCPLLGNNQQCSIYSARPLACRSYWSLNASACLSFLNLESMDEIPKPDAQYALREDLTNKLFNLSNQATMLKIPLAWAVADPFRWLQNQSITTPVSWTENLPYK